MGIRVTRQSIFNDFKEQMFNGDYDKCYEWFYHTPLEGLQNLTMDDIVRSPRSWKEAQTFLVAYRAGREGRYL